MGNTVNIGALESSEAISSTAIEGTPSLRQIIKKRLRYPLHEPKRLAWNLPWYRKAGSLIDEQKPDVVLVRSSLLTFSAVLAGQRRGLPVVLEVNSPAAESRQYFDQYFHLPLLPEAIEGWRLRRVDGITTVSTALKQFLVDSYDLQSEKITTVPNGADLVAFRPDTLPDPEWESFSREGTVIGFIGSFKKWHGPELLRDMALRVAEDRPETRFLLVGDGPGREAVEQALHPIAHRTQFTGRVPHDRIPGITALLDVAVMPESNFYGSPLKVIEWMAAGRAIVAPDYGPLCEIIDTGRQGILFERGNVEDLVGAVVKLTDNVELRQGLGEAAHIRAVKSLSWSHNAAKVIDACQRAIERHSQSSRQTR